MNAGKQPQQVATTTTSFTILEYLIEAEGATLGDIAEEFDLAKSTVHRHVTTLSRLGYVVAEDNEYQIAVKTLVFGDYAQRRKDGFVLAREKVDEMADRTGERVQFIVEEHGRGVYVFASHGEKAVRNEPRLGKVCPLHHGASGKMILASLPDNRVHEIIDTHGLPAYTENTITDPDTLFEELERIQARGHSYNREEHIEGLNAVAVGIEEPDGELLGTLSVGGPSERLQGEYFTEELPQQLKGAANEIELNLRHTS